MGVMGDRIRQAQPDPSIDLLNSSPDLNLPPPLPSLIPSLPDPTPTLPQSINSLFYDINSLNSTFSSSNKPIIASLNVQSLQSKHASLSQFILECQTNKIPLSILALQETWQIPHPDLVNIPGFNLIHSQRKNNRGGGVGFYIKDNINFKTVKTLSPFIPYSFECLTIEIILKSKRTSISSIYRSPNPPPRTSLSTHHETFINQFDNLLHQLSSQYHESFILLDSNLNLLTPTLSPITNSYINTINSNGFIQTIQKATRTQNSSHSLIDHILINSHSPEIITGTLILDISDHFLTFIQLPSPHPLSYKKTQTNRDFNSQNVNRLRDSLKNLTWNDTLSCNDVDLSYNHFWDSFKPLYNLCIPIKTKKFNKNIHKISNHITQGILISRSTKLNLHKTSIISPTPENIAKYRTYRNLYNKLNRISKKLYYENNLKMAEKDPKKSWQILKEALNLPQKNSKIDKLKINGIEINNKKEIANHLNNFFADAGTQIYNSTHPTSKTPDSYLSPNEAPDLELHRTSPASIQNTIKLLQPKSSLDINGLSMKLLKSIAPEISVPLSHIFNLSITQGIFPTSLKSSRITPIHKGGDNEVCDNYRPIALQSTIAKILEKTIAISLTNHLDLNKLLHKNQFGFQKGKNTEQNLLLVTDFIANALNDGDYCVGVFLDLRKAFDTVPHDILLKKLKHLGVRGTALRWFKSYLENREQRVDIDGDLSDPREINISVLQGSILGPILFLCYINDLPNSSKLLTFLFADDTQGLARGRNLPALLDEINVELKSWAAWFRSNKMKVNTSKTKYIIFHTKGKKVETNGKVLIYDDNDNDLNHEPSLITPLDRIHSNHPDPNSRYYKLLGVYFDENLNFNHQINQLSSKLSKAIYCINRAKNVLPKKALLSLYFALFHSHLTYCPSIISCTSNQNIQKIFKLQKKIIRIITLSGYSSHTSPLFKNLKILQYPDLINQSKLNIMHTIHYETAPSSLLNLWPKNQIRNRNYELRNTDDYEIPRSNYAFFTRSPAYSFTKLWNNSTTVTPHRNHKTFKIAVKNMYLNSNSE